MNQSKRTKQIAWVCRHVNADLKVMREGRFMEKISRQEMYPVIQKHSSKYNISPDFIFKVLGGYLNQLK